MGEYHARDRLGLPVVFAIDGERPSPTEMGRITDYLAKGDQPIAPEKPAPEQPGIMSLIGGSLASGWNQIQAGVEDIPQSYFESTGQPSRAKYWADLAAKDRAEAASYKTAETGVTTAKTWGESGRALVGTAAESAPSMALSLGGMYVGGEAGAAIGGVLTAPFGGIGAVPGALIGGILGGAAGMYPQMLESNAQRQMQEHPNKPVDWEKAHLAAAGQATVESVANRFVLGAAGIMGKGGKKLAPDLLKMVKEAADKAVGDTAKIVFKRVGVTAGEGLLVGATEETIQQVMERAQADLPLLDDQAKREYLESAIAGGLLEGAFGAGAGALGVRGEITHRKKIDQLREDHAADVATAQAAQTINAPLNEAARQTAAAPVTPPITTVTPAQPINQDNLLPKGLQDDEVIEPEPVAASKIAPFPATAEEAQASVDARLSPEEQAKLHKLRGTTPPETPQAEGIPFTITHGMRAKLADLGYAPYHIRNMTPVVANDIIKRGLTKQARDKESGMPDLPPAPGDQSTTQQSTTEAQAATPTPPLAENVSRETKAQEPVKPSFSETDYRNAISQLRNFNSVSLDRIVKVLKVNRQQAKALFDEMLHRNDAAPTGNKSQYLQVTAPHNVATDQGTSDTGKTVPHRTRDYTVQPVKPPDFKPFSIEVQGRKQGGNFATQEEAQAYIDANVPDNHKGQTSVVEDNAGMQYGVHEVQYQHQPGKPQKQIGSTLVSTHSTEQEANEALKKYDPAFSPESNKLKENQTVETRQAAVDEDLANTLGVPLSEQLKTQAENIVGKGRVGVSLEPSIPVTDEQGRPIPGAVVEGKAENVREKDNIQKVIRNLITLATDLYHPNLTEEQRSKLLQDVMNHELVHVLRNLDLLTRKEWNTLAQAATRPVPGKLYSWYERAAIRNPGTPEKPATPVQIEEEAIAEMVRHYLNDPTSFRNPERGLFKKIADFIKKMIGLAQRHNAEDLMDTIFSGGIKDRDIGHGGLGQRTEEDTFYSLIKPDNFFLKSENFLTAVTQKQASPQDWKGRLKNAGIRQEEENWLGLNDWLDAMPHDRVVAKDEILNFIRANDGIDIKILTGPGNELSTGTAERPEYANMQTKGGQDYTEALLIFKPRLGEPTYQSNHWMHDNVLAHVRFKTIIDENGRKVLFIEEMQSDLHQDAAKAGGYYSENLMEDYDRLGRELDDLQRQASDVASDTRIAYQRVNVKTEAMVQWQRKARLFRHPERSERSQASIDADANVDRLTAELDAAQKAYWRVEAEELRLNNAVRDKSKEHELTRKRLNIPNAPFKTGWEDYVIKRLIRHASEHDFDAVAWHGQPEGIAEAEQWPSLTSEIDLKRQPVETESWRPIPNQMTHKIGYGDKNVTPIVNRYLEKLPAIVRKLAQRFGAYLDINEASGTPGQASGIGSYTPPDFEHPDEIMAEFPTKGSIVGYYRKMVARQDMELMNPNHTQEREADQDQLLEMMQTAAQIARNQRVYNPAEAFKKAHLITETPTGDIEALPLQDILIWTQSNGTWDDVENFRDPKAKGPSKGAFPWKHFRLDLNSAMKEDFAKGNVPRFSMVAPQYSQTAPLGQRVPVNPPIDALSAVHNKITYDNLSPVIKRMMGFAPQFHGAVDESIIALQDRMLSVGRLIDRIKKNGGFISTENDSYLRETLYSGQTDAHLQENDRKFFKPMEQTIKGLHVTTADYNEAKTLSDNARLIVTKYPKNFRHALAELYVYARHAQERNAEMRRRNANFQKDAQGNILRDPNGDPIPVRDLQYWQGSGMADGEAQHILDWFASKPFAAEFDSETNPNSVRSRMRAINSSTNDVRVAGGMTPEFRTMTYGDGTPVNVYKDYAPIRGFLGEATIRDDLTDDFARTGKGFNIRGKEDFAALGRESLGADLIATAMKQNEEAVVRAGKNKVTQSFKQLILDNPGEFDGSKPNTPKVAEVLHVPRSKWVYDTKSRQVVERTDQTLENDKTVLKGKENGHTFYIKVHDPLILRAFGAKTSLGNVGLGTMMRGLMKTNRILASMRTSYNPDFMISNMLRDLQTALINLSEYDQKGLRSKVMSTALPAMNGVRKALRSGDMTSEWGKVFHEFQHYGGHTAIMGIKELADTVADINKTMGEDASGAPGKVWKQVKRVGKFIEDYNLAIENGTRLAAYRALRDKYLELSGDPTLPANQKRAKEMAAFAAKKLTVDFNMGGESKSLMSALYMFYNASIQGSMAMINPFIRSRKMKKVWGGVLLAGIAQDIMMSMLSATGDDGEKEYDRIPDYVLEHNMVFMDPFGISERGYFKIPMPYLMNSIYNWGRSISRTARGKYTAGQLLHTGGMTMIDSLNPWGGTNSLLNFVAPTIIDPVVDLAQNEDFTGKPIAPPVSPYDNTGVNRSQQYWNNTNPAFVTVADWMSALTGRKGDFIPGVMEYSPNQVEYVINWATGGTGMFLARGAGIAMNVSRGERPELGQVPILRAFTGQITSRNDLQSYIEGRDQVMRVRESLRSARKNGDHDAYQRIMRNYPDEYKAANRINSIENGRKRLATKIKHIRDSKRIPDAQKEARIKALKDRQDKLVGVGNKTLEAANIQ